MKRIANEQLIMKAFQEITSHVTLEKMIELLAKKYEVWQNATQTDIIDDGYVDKTLWFEEYYDSIINDCIEIAKQDNNELEEYLSVFTGEDMSELEEQLGNYILTNQEELLDNLNENNQETIDIDLDEEE